MISHILWKIKNVPNHQPASISPCNIPFNPHQIHGLMAWFCLARFRLGSPRTFTSDSWDSLFLMFWCSPFSGWWVSPYPSETWWSESQLGLWHSQLNGKSFKIPWFQSPPSSFQYVQTTWTLDGILLEVPFFRVEVLHSCTSMADPGRHHGRHGTWPLTTSSLAVLGAAS